jgi:hypothetical protein
MAPRERNAHSALGWTLIKSRRYTEALTRSRAFEAMLRARAQDESGARVSGVVFSRNRALQLEALLSSYECHAANRGSLHILYRADSDRHARAYLSVLSMHSASVASAVPQRAFREDILSLLSSIETERLFFLVDDQLFVRPVDLSPLCALDPCRFVPSLRLGLSLDYCFTRDAPQRVPTLSPLGSADSRLFQWRWSDGEHDWGYPLSLDGHLFSRLEILACIRELPFSAPNSLEGALQMVRNAFLPRQGVCLERPAVVNIPTNRVQNEIANTSGDITADQLLDRWEAGERLHWESYRDVETRSAHALLEARFVARAGTSAGTRS